MRIAAILTAGIVLFALAGPALAASQSDWEDCKAQSSDPDRSISGCTRIINGDEENRRDRAIAYSMRAAAYLHGKGDTDRAIADENESIRLDPERGGAAYSIRASAYYTKGDPDRAIADENEAIRLDPKVSVYYFVRGSAYEKMGNTDRAIADFNEAIQLDPKAAGAYANRCLAYLRKGNSDLAIADCNQAISINPKLANAHDYRGGVLSKKGNYELAIADFNQAIDLDPKLLAAYASRASAYSKTSKYDLAVADYDQAISIDPKNSALYFGRGRVNLYAGSLDKSLADLNQANVLAPKHAYAALWLDIVSQRNKLPSRLPQTSSQLDMTAWPAPVIRLFMGQTTPSALLTAAESPDAKTRNARVCETNFYTGELSLMEGSKVEAIRLLRLAASDCPHDFLEWDGANADLKLLDAAY
jgi:tetratricopeptide (TPR) repeat protein